MFVNATPHDVNVYDASKNPVKVIGISKEVQAQVKASRKLIGVFGGAEIYEIEYGQPSPLPAPQEGVFYIVSSLYAAALRAAGDKRPDILTPGDSIRSDTGQVIGCVGFNVA